ncbi:MAG: PLP-dependent aminotransferase family protein [Thermoprotei archaeon]
MKIKISERGSRVELSPVEEATKIAIKSGVINLASGSPDPRVVPVNELKSIAIKVLEERGVSALAYPNAGGQDELKTEIKKYMDSFGISIEDDEDVVVTSGAQHAFKLIADLLVEKNSIVIVENPTFYETLAPFKFHGASVIGVSLDNEGLNIDELRGFLGSSKINGGILYVIPTCHNPTGITMSIERRKELIEIASQYDLLVIEDDPYRPIAVDTPPPLKKFDQEGRVLYVGSFSKILAPGLRIGWIYGSKLILDKLALLEQLDFAVSTFTQYVVVEALRSGLISRLIPKLTNHYKSKMHIMYESLENYMPSNVKWINSARGFFLLVRVTGVDMEGLLTKAIDHGVVYVPARRFFTNGKHSDAIRLSVSLSNEENIKKGVWLLSSLIKSVH